MKLSHKIVITSIILVILLIGLSTINATSNDSSTNNTIIQNEPVVDQNYNNTQYINTNQKDNNQKLVYNTSTKKKTTNITSNKNISYVKSKTINTSQFNIENKNYFNTTSSKNQTENSITVNKHSSCCSVVVQVSNKESVISFRRDSTYQATINIIKTTMYGVNITKQYKTNGTYFVHVITTSNGWVMGFGGADRPTVQSNIVAVAGEMFSKNSITNASMSKIYDLLKQLTIGHAVIKAPDGRIGIAIYNKGGTYFVSKLSNGEYVCVPNDASFYHRGIYTHFSKDPINASINIAGTDKYGINRRDIITYHNIVSNQNQILNIYVTDDTGKLVNKKDLRLNDPINCFGKYISTKLLPEVPNKILIGTINTIKTEIPTTYNIIPSGKTKTNNIYNVINLINKFGQNNKIYTINIAPGKYTLDKTALSLYNINIKNITVLFKGSNDNTILNGKNNDILNIESNFNVQISNITLISGINRKAINNKGNLEVLNSNLINNNNDNPTIYNTGTLIVRSSAFKTSNAIYNKGTVKFINNNWWGTNNPNWNKLLTNVNSPSRYVIMKVNNITTYENNEIKIKVTLELNNEIPFNEIPEQNIKFMSNTGRFNPTITKIKDKTITTYRGNPGNLKVSIDEQTIEMTIEKPHTEISLNPTTTTRYSNTTILTGTIKFLHGNYIKGIEKINIRINGKNLGNYNAINGIINNNITIPNTLKNTKYILTIKLGNNNQYYGTITNTTLTINNPPKEEVLA